jgi:hypothetical protein
MEYAEMFRDFMKSEGVMDKKEVEAVYFRDNGGCYPSSYIGDDLLINIYKTGDYSETARRKTAEKTG